jgi:hypothetical protein
MLLTISPPSYVYVPSPLRSPTSVSQESVTGMTKSTIFPARVSLKLTAVPCSVTPR